jgi:hypothetical protein
MKRYLEQKSGQLRAAVLARIAWLTAADSILQVSAEGASTLPLEQKPWCAVAMPGTFVATSRRYKAISRKELLAIVNNEREFLSPFDEPRSLYRVTETDEGGWLVDFYFIDLKRYPQLSEVFALIPGDQFVRNLVGEDASSLNHFHGELGDFLVYQHRGAWLVKRFSQRLVESLRDESQTQERILGYEPSDLAQGLFNAMLSASFWSQRGAAQWSLVPAWLKQMLAKPMLWRNVAMGVVVWVGVQFVYFMATDWLITNEASSSADIRRAYAAEKTAYLADLDQLVAMQGLIAKQSRLHRLGGLFEALSSSGEVKLNRFDYRDGEYRIAGVTDDIDTLISGLSQFPGVSGVDFNSPVRPDRAGLDQFDLRFEIADE